MAESLSPGEVGEVLKVALEAGIAFLVTQSVLAAVFAHQSFWKTSWVIATIFMGPGVLRWPAVFDLAAITAALTALYPVCLVIVLILFSVMSSRSIKSGILVGAALGMAFYFVDLYGLANWFPWLIRDRTWLVAVSHIALGAAAGSWLERADTRGRSAYRR